MAQEGEWITKIEKFGDVEIEAIYRKAREPITKEEVIARQKIRKSGAATFAFCPELKTCTYILEDNILVEQDVPLTLSDGTIIYSDIYRPAGIDKVPVIISWSFFGKRPGAGMDEWQIMGVPPHTVSNMTKFESSDPGYWCRHGYAVANVDPRGVGHSQGNLNIFGTADARDAYEYIEWLSEQYWCSGRIGLFGNSGVGMTQYRIAAEQPPHLVCMAPWEATGDIYREALFEGGIPALGFNEFVVASITGEGYIDDIVAMAKKYPLMNAYWEDKIPKFENIKIPVYLTAGWSHFHLHGTMEAFRKIKSTRKWLRTHREFEWPDTYSRKGLEDLRCFFDRYLKQVRNGWELTPKVRIEVMDAYDFDYQTDRTENKFPLERTEYKKLYLNAENGSMNFEPVTNKSNVSYEGETGTTTFDFRFIDETELTGYMKLLLWVEAQGNDDMDLFITIQKLDANGKWLPTSVLGEPHPGAWGKMRVSLRKLDEKKSTPYQPVQLFQEEEKLSPGEIVPVNIEIWPHSRIWHKGEQIRVLISGHYIRDGWFEPFSWETNNKGQHVIHTGGKYDSYLQIPLIPPRHVSGDFIVR